MQAHVVRANLIQQIRKEQLFNDRDHLVVAVSGGYDSLHLLYWLTELGLPADLQPKVSALYVNHQLRDDAKSEEQLIEKTFAKLADRLQTAEIVRLNWEAQPTSAVEEQARAKRYAELVNFARKVGANKIVTAHHQGDQVETILYKLLRGGQLSQLGGMARQVEYTDDIDLIRPFLGLSKEQLSAVLHTPITEWIEDYTNQDRRYARNLLRGDVLPMLERINQRADQNIIKFSEQIMALEQLATPVLAEKVDDLERGTLDWTENESILVLVLQKWLNNQDIFNVKDRQLLQAITMMRNQNINRGEILLADGLSLLRIKNQLNLIKKDL